MEQTTPPPTKPVMDIARPKSAVPTSPQSAAPTASAVPATSSPAAVPVAELPPAANSGAPAASGHPQLTVHKAPDDEAASPSSDPQPKHDDQKHKKPLPETPAHATLPARTGSHAPAGVITMTIVVMIILSAVAVMIYTNGQK